jgi:S-formylglutathione hydrolase FrmB
MKDGTGLFSPEQQPHDTTCVRQRNYGSYIADDLVGWVDHTYRTIAKKQGRGIAGLSMGGFGAIDHALLDGKFAAAASHSGAIEPRFIGPRPYDATKPPQLLADPAKFGAGGKIGPWIARLFGPAIDTWKQHDIVELLARKPAAFKDVALYFDCGSEDDFHLQDNLAYVHDQLAAHKIPHEIFVGPGKHNFELWTARVPFSLAFLRDHTAKPVN